MCRDADELLAHGEVLVVGNIDEDSARVLAAASPEQVVIDLTRRGSGRGAAAPARS